MKKFLIAAMIVSIMFAYVGCGSDSGGDDDPVVTTYTVTFDGNKPTGAGASDSVENLPASVTIEAGKTLDASLFDLKVGTPPADNEKLPTLEGYLFVGWYTDKTWDQEFEAAVTGTGAKPAVPASIRYSKDTKIEKDVKLFARWVEDTETIVAITFKSNYTGGPADIVIYIVDGETLDPTEPGRYVPVRSGYELMGWYEEALCTNAVSAAAAAKATLFAKWQIPVTWVDNYDADDSDFASSSESKTYFDDNDDLVLKSALTRTGFEFQGWFTAATGGTKVEIATPTAQKAVKATYYAQWKIEVTFDLNGGEVSVSDSETEIVVAFAKGATLEYPTTTSLKPPAGKVFDKWDLAAAGNSATALPTTVTEPVKIYAIWDDE